MSSDVEKTLQDRNLTLREAYKKALNDCHDYMDVNIFNKGCFIKSLIPFFGEEVRGMLIQNMDNTRDDCGQIQDTTSFGIYVLLQNDLFPDNRFVSLSDVFYNDVLDARFVELQQKHISNDECLVPDISNTLATLNLDLLH